MIKIFQVLLSKFFNAFLQAFLDHLVQQIGATSSAVSAMAHDLNNDTTLSGEEKAKKLASQLKSLAILNGKEFSNSTVNLIVEVACKVVRGGI